MDKLSTYDYSTSFRRAFLKSHGATADWLTKSTEFVNWMSDPNSNMFLLSGKREYFSQVNSLFFCYLLPSWIQEDRH